MSSGKYTTVSGSSSSAAFQLSTAFEQVLPGPALPGLVTLGHFLRAGGGGGGTSSTPAGSLGDATYGLAVVAPPSSGGGGTATTSAESLSLAVCSSGNRVFIHNNHHAVGSSADQQQQQPQQQQLRSQDDDYVDDDDRQQDGGESGGGVASTHRLTLDGKQTKKMRSKQKSSKHQGSHTRGGDNKNSEEEEEDDMLEMLGDSKVVTLSFGREPTAIAAGAGFKTSNKQEEEEEGNEEDADVNVPSGARPRSRRRRRGGGVVADALLLGTSQSVLAYDVRRHQEFFYKELEEGTRVLAHGKIQKTRGAAAAAEAAAAQEGEAEEALTLIGSNGAVLGVDRHGEERFWAVVGDRVTSMAMMPWGASKEEAGGGGGGGALAAAAASLHLVAASDDHVIRVFRGSDVVAQMVEADVVHQIIPQWSPYGSSSARHSSSSSNHHHLFAYLLENGTVGVYDGESRLWRVKGTERAVSATFCDVDGDGVDELVVGWASGAVEVRRVYGSSSGESAAGEVLFHYMCPQTSVASLLTADYRGDGRRLPLLTTTDGRVQGLLLHPQQHSAVEQARELALLDAKIREKKILEARLASLTAQLETLANGEQDATMPAAQTVVNVATVPNPATRKLDVQFYLSSSHPSTVISSVVLRCDPPLGGGGEDAWCFIAGDTPSPSLLCPITYDRVQASRFHASVTVGGLHAANAQVMELQVAIPAFVMYYHLDAAMARWSGILPPSVLEEKNQYHPHNNTTATKRAGSSGDGSSKPNVSLFFNEDLHYPHFSAMLRRLFAIPSTIALESHPEDESGHAMDAFYRVPIIHLVSMEVITIEIRQPSSTSAWRQVILTGASMEMCGDILLQMEADLPDGFAEKNGVPVHVRYRFDTEGEMLRGILQTIYERNDARGTLSVGMADAVGALRLTLIQAEDARLLGELSAMKSAYTTVMDYNQELLDDNRKRLNNFEELKSALREVNLYIQRAARLRLGRDERTTFVTACRTALRDNNTSELVDLIAKGIQ